MNGVSNMLPFTVAGGIFIALAFLIDTLMGVQPGDNFGTVTPVAAFFKTIGGYAFNFMIPVLAGYIGKSIADRPGFLVGLVGGYLATTGSTFVKIGGDVPSGFLGALFAGFVGGFIMLGLEKLCDKMPKALNGIKPVLIYPPRRSWHHSCSNVCDKSLYGHHQHCDSRFPEPYGRREQDIPRRYTRRYDVYRYGRTVQ